MKDLNQMADTFFNFSSLKNGEHITLPEEEDGLEFEEEYDALNNETFGDLESDISGDDWEQQHEQFAEFAKSSVDEDRIEDSLKSLVLSDISDPLSLSGNSVWSYTPPAKNGEISSVLSSLHKASQSFVQSRLENQGQNNNLQQVFDRGTSTGPFATSLINSPKPTPKICTVEELEKDLLKSSKNAPQLPNASSRLPLPNQFIPQHSFQGPVHPPTNQVPHSHAHFGPPHPSSMYLVRPSTYQGPPIRMGGPNRYPPGLPPMNMPPPMRQMPHAGFRMMPSHPFLQRNMPMRPNPNGPPYPYHMNPQAIPPHFQRGNMPPSMQQYGNRGMIPQQYHQQYHLQQRQRTHSGRYEGNHQYDRNYTRDEYDGLMTAKEKQWLLNIQLLQLNTGTPYFDDYYYTVFKERKARGNKENSQYELFRFQQGRQRRNSDRQENQPTPRVYTPLQFENSLGKLQIGSVTAPRKIIDMDVVNCDKDSETTPVSSKDSRKTKQLLLELEKMYSMFLKAEDLTNPMAINNLKVLRDIKQKQRLRELETATTPEQKQEVLELVKRESEPVVENPHDYMQKILSTLLHEDKFTSFMNIRKGKVLLLRLLPVLSNEQFSSQVVEIWSRLLLSIPIIGRRDTAGDNLLPKLYPIFKRYIQTVKMSDILENVSCLTEVNKLENSRSTPLSHQGKAPLYFVLMNKFGISVITALFVRSEFLIATNGATEKQQDIWFNFIITVADLLCQISRIPTPLEGIPQATFKKLCHRVPILSSERIMLLNKHLVEVSSSQSTDDIN